MELTTASVFGVSLPGLHDLPEDFVWDPVVEARSPIIPDVVLEPQIKQDDEVYPCPRCTGLLPRHVRHNHKAECVRFMLDLLNVGGTRMEWYTLRS